MNYTINFSKSLGSLVVPAEGFITVSDVSSLIDDLIEKLAEEAVDLIVDYTAASAEKLTSEDIWQISVDCNRLADPLTGKKLAVLVDDIDYGMGRMWQSFTELKVPFEIRIFRDLSDAENWMTETTSEL